jgi:hypothetical protein
MASAEKTARAQLTVALEYPMLGFFVNAETLSCMDKSIFTPEHQALQQVLRQLRLGAGLRQEDLAERLGEPQSFVSKVESGDRRLDLVELRQIAGALGVTLADIVRRFEEHLSRCKQTRGSSVSPPSSGRTSG